MISIKDYNYQSILFVHNYVLMYLIFVFCVLLVCFFFALYSFEYKWRTDWIVMLWQNRNSDCNKLIWGQIYIFGAVQTAGLLFVHSFDLEIYWTIFPILIIIQIILPSLTLIVSTERMRLLANFFTLHVTANQWYWEYTVNIFEKKKRYISRLRDLRKHRRRDRKLTRLLATTSSVIVPVGIKTNVFVTSNDVIHSWSIPGLGIKVDAIPGRLNLKRLVTTRLGLYSGMCSELCGIEHAYMPISLNSVSVSDFEYIEAIEEFLLIVLQDGYWSLKNKKEKNKKVNIVESIEILTEFTLTSLKEIFSHMLGITHEVYKMEQKLSIKLLEDKKELLTIESVKEIQETLKIELLELQITPESNSLLKRIELLEANVKKLDYILGLVGCDVCKHNREIAQLKKLFNNVVEEISEFSKRENFLKKD